MQTIFKYTYRPNTSNSTHIELCISITITYSGGPIHVYKNGMIFFKLKNNVSV